MDRLTSSVELLGDVASLRARLVEDGYLYLPGLLDVEEVLAVQTKLRHALTDSGWLPDCGTLRVAHADLRFTAESFRTLYPAILAIEEFHRLAYTAALWQLMEELLQGEIFCHPAKVARLSPPTGLNGGYFTRAHQDFVVLHVASDVLTAWIPLSTCTEDREGLRVLADSHRSGFLPTDASVGGARPLYLPVADDDKRWMTVDYQLGDAVVFHSLTVHGGGPNTSDEMRLSADVRYQLTSDPLRSAFVHPHGWPKTPDWDELCGDWQTRRWIHVPREVPLVDLPTDVSYAEFLQDLVAPPSRLLGHGASRRAVECR